MRTTGSVQQEYRHAWRLIWRTPAQSLAAMMALALGIGMTTALFSVVSAVLLKPLPYADPEQLIVVGGSRSSGRPVPRMMTGEHVYGVLGLAAESPLFAAVAPFEVNSHRAYAWLAGEGDGAGEVAGMERLRRGLVTPAFFGMLGVQAAVGRTFRVDDDGTVVVISDSLWRRRFGADPGVIGRAVQFDDVTQTIVGVLPPRVHLTYPEEIEVWGLQPPGQFTGHVGLSFNMLARLRPGVRPEQATAALRTVPGLMPRSARAPDGRAIALPVRDWVAGPYRPALRLLTGAVLLLLLTACLNASLLLLTRALRRVPDTAVRVALGATRRQLLRQDLVESGVVGLGGVGLGVLLAVGTLPLVRRLAPATVPRLDEAAIDPWVIGVAVAAGVAATIVTGLVTYHGVSTRVGTPGPGPARATAPTLRRGRAWGHALLVAQTALIVALLAGGGLLLHSFWRLTQVDLGYQTRDLHAFQLRFRLTAPEVWEAEAFRFREQVRRRLAESPGVSEVGTSSTLPLRGWPGSRSWVPQGQPMPAERRVNIRARRITPGFLRLLGIRLVDGRALSARDTRDAARVAIVSASLARELYGDQRAVGQTLYWDDSYEVVGVAADVHWERPDAPPTPALYLAAAQEESTVVSVVARTTLAPAAFAAAARAAVHAVDPRQAVNFVTTLDQAVADAVAAPRFYAAAMVGFGLLALALGAVGIFGAVSAAVSERVHEIGIRMALGAGPRAVQRLVLAQGLGPVVAGLGLGAVAAFWVIQGLRRFLFEVRPADPLTLTAVPLVVLAVAVLAAWLPARWALRIDPVEALRRD